MARRSDRSLGWGRVPAYDRMHRGVILVALVALAGAALANASVNVFRAERPELALAVSPGDAGALAAKADAMLTSQAGNVSADQLDKLALRSISAQPISARAVRLHGFAADRRADAAGALRSMNLAEKLSRRELMAHLWMIENAAQRGNTGEVIHYYDIAMRTSDSGRRILFPILAGALPDREIRANLLPYLRADPPWLASFLSYAVLEGRDPVSVAALIQEAGKLPDTSRLVPIQRQLLGRMVDAAGYDAARSFALRVMGADPRIFSDVGFDPLGTDAGFAPLTWVRPSSAGISTEFLKVHGQWIARTSGEANARGLALQRLLFLAPGSYSVGLPVDLKEGAGTIQLAIGCRVAGHDSTLLDQELDLKTPHQFVVAVPANCGAQFLSISMQTGEAGEGATFELRSPTIRRLQTP